MGSPVKVGGVRVTECSSESGIWIGGFRGGQSGPGLAFGLAQSDAPEAHPDLLRSGRSVGGTSGVAVGARWLRRGRRVFASSRFKDDMVRCEVQRARRRSGEWGALGERRPVAPRELHGPYLRAHSISLQVSQLLSNPLRCALMRSPSSQPRPGDDGREIRTGRASDGPPFEGSARLTVLVLIASISCQSRPPREKEGRIVYSAVRVESQATERPSVCTRNLVSLGFSSRLITFELWYRKHVRRGDQSYRDPERYSSRSLFPWTGCGPS